MTHPVRPTASKIRVSPFRGVYAELSSHHRANTRCVGHFIKMTLPTLTLCRPCPIHSTKPIRMNGRVVLTKRPTLCVQQHLKSVSHPCAAYMRSFPPHHRANTRCVGHFIKMTLPQNTNSSPRSLCDLYALIFLGTTIHSFLGALGELGGSIFTSATRSRWSAENSPPIALPVDECTLQLRK